MLIILSRESQQFCNLSLIELFNLLSVGYPHFVMPF